MKRTLKPVVLFGALAVLLTLSLFRLLGGQPSLKIEPPKPPPRADQLTFKLQVQSGSNGVAYVIQASTNLVDWKPVITVRPQAGESVSVSSLPATNAMSFFRLMEYLSVTDTNPPVWTNGVGDGFSVLPPAAVVARWKPAMDNLGVAEYRLYLNGVLLTNVPGTTLEHQFTVDLHQRSDLRIQAVDASGNATDILSLVYLPGDKLAAVSDDGGRVYLFQVQADGTFSAAQPVANFGALDRGVGIGDFDRDGVLDLCAGYAEGNVLKPFFLKGNGDGTFASPVALPIASGANSHMMNAAVGDFDCDGNLDFVVNGYERYVFFYWGNGDGTFRLEVKDWGTSGIGLAAGDFNEDGRIDLVRTTYSDGAVRLFLSNGDRTFTETNRLGKAGTEPYGPVAGDFDEDGHLDLITSSDGNGDVTFFKGFGNSTFTNLGVNGVRANLDVNDYGAFVTADYDGDGHLDLVLATYNNRAVYFWAGNGDGTFSTNRVTLATGIGRALGISAPPLPPRVEVNLSPTDPVINLNQSLTFQAMGAGVISNDFFRWTFGDQGTNPLAWTFTTNMTNMGPTFSHAFTNEGRFVSRLWHTDARGLESVRGTWVTVRGQPPVSRPGGPYVYGEQTATQAVWSARLDASASTDDFGIVNYLWTFGDGQSLTNGPIVIHGYTNIGPWQVGLTVFDASGLSNSNSTTVTFTPGDPPVAVIDGPAVVDESSAKNGVWTTTFYATNSTDDFGIWKYDWNFGDGKTGNGRIVQTTYNAIGNYVVTLIVTDHAGQTNSATHDVVIKADGLPTANITGPRLLNEFVCTNGQWFGQWSGAASTDDRGVYRYDWNFGDGTTGSGLDITHQYSAPGIYSLGLTVTDFGNQTASTTQKVAVVVNDPPVAKIAASTLTPEGAQPVRFSALNSTDDRGIMSYRWFFPARRFDFDGQAIDTSLWSVANARQDGRMIVTGKGDWEHSWFFSVGIMAARGSALQGRVDTPSGAVDGVVGFRNLNNASSHYYQFTHALWFQNGDIYVYEYGNGRGLLAHYSPGSSYEIRIETKTGSGARYFFRPAGTQDPFTFIYESNNYSDDLLGFGATVSSGVFGFDEWTVDSLVLTQPEVTTGVYPGGLVTLEVVDHARQTNQATVTISPIVAAPPIAVISGPTNSQSGIEISYDASRSSDDHAIASYTWDFGDGSPASFGPVVSHAYTIAGVYTNTLLIVDYAGQTSLASLVVRVDQANTILCVPWSIRKGIELPHETYSGKEITLKAVAPSLPLPFDYIWNYGDGSPMVTNTVTNLSQAYGLEAKHVYLGSDKTPFQATIRVMLTNGTAFSDTYPLIIRPKSLDVEMNIAIDEGLWNLHKIQTRYDIDANNKGGYWTYRAYNTFYVNVSASAVQAFAVNGHLMTDDASQDPYVETVRRGINFLLGKLGSVSIGPQRFGDPDGNHNGFGLSSSDPRPPYEVGPVMDALVAATQPEWIAPVGSGNVKGRTLHDIMQDMVDIYAWGQDDNDTGGGWRYSWGDWPDNSASQWGAIGLTAAERYWGIAAPQWVKDHNQIWIQTSRGGSGFGYTGPGDGDATTPSALVQLAYDGVSITNSLWRHGEDYLGKNWDRLMSLNNVYANYAIAKSLRSTIPEPVSKLTLTGKEWFLDPGNGLARVTIDRQSTNGSWMGSGAAYDNDPQLATAWSLLILSSSLFQIGPVAVIHLKPNPAARGYPVVFDATTSYHKHPSYRIVEYRWDFDASDGIDFDHPDAVGPVVTNSYPRLSTNTVSLQIRDNGTPQLYSSANAIVRVTVPPYPPTADAGGPYLAGVGEDVHLNGSGSFDVDAAFGDYISSWDWEVDNITPYDFNDGVSGQFAVFTGGFSTPGVKDIGLRVKDATSIVYPQLGSPDLTGEDFAKVYVYEKVITNLTARAKGEKVQLGWTKTGDYGVLQRSTNGPDQGYLEIGRTDSDYATFLDTNVVYRTEYYYRIFAYRNGQSDPIGVSNPEYCVSLPREFENSPPRFLSTPPAFATVGKLYETVLQAMDPENDPFVFNMLSGPTNMTLNSTNGLVQFTPQADQLGSHPVSFEVTNNTGRDVLNYTLVVQPVTNQPPVVNANGPYQGMAGQSIQFSSAGTSDPEGDALLYYWVFGDGVISTNPNPAHTYYAKGNYTVMLFVNDGYGGTTSAATQATISRLNHAPVANAGNDQSPRVTQTVYLNGRNSSDADFDPLTYQWSVVMRPTNSSAALANATSVRPSLVVDEPGTYVIQLVVNDGFTNSAPSAAILTTINSPPIANAGPAQRVPQGQMANLDGSASRDVDHNALTYRWSFVGRPTNSVATLVNASAVKPSFVTDLEGEYFVQLIVNDGTVDSSPATVRITTGNLPPIITSTPPLTAIPSVMWNYRLTAVDPDSTALTFTLITAPDGLTLTNVADNPNECFLQWIPTRDQIGGHNVTARVMDVEGAIADQSFAVIVGADTTPPVVSLQLIQGEYGSGGQWAARIGDTAAFRLTALDNLGVASRLLRVGSQELVLNDTGYASMVASNAGLYSVTASATDPEGNIGVTNTTILFYDPLATNDIFIQFHSPSNYATITKPEDIVATITNATDLVSYRVDYAPVSTVDLDNISVEGPQFTVLTNVTLPAGTREINQAIVAKFDPTILLNDSYLVRIVASDGRSLQYGGLALSVANNLKFGEFHIEFTDLQVPVVGIPITITRVYDTREANRQGDFGYGWSLGVRDAKIRKTLRSGSMYVGSRVYLTKPDGRRVGFTTVYQPSSWLFPWIGTVLLQPDAGVYEKLEIIDNSAIHSGGLLSGGLGTESYNPATFRLTTKDGTIYTYHETEGLQSIQDLNNNTLTFTTNGIFHSSGQRVDFIRDTQGRITQILDPDGVAIKYAYGNSGDLRSFTDQVTNVTQYFYSSARAHYLTNIIDPLGRNALQIEYDSAGRLVAIRDALGNPIQQNFDLDSKTATFKDANGHTNIVRYDDNGNEVMKVIPGISTNYSAFDANNNEIWHQDARGFVTTRSYDSRGNLTQIVDALSNVTAIAYNDLNKPTSLTDALGRTTTFRYDGQGQFTNMVNSLGRHSSFTRDDQGRATSASDFNGRTTLYDYAGGCSCGKPSRVVSPDGTSCYYEYNSHGLAVRETDELGRNWLLFYDDADRLIWVRDAASNVTTYAYASTLKLSETDPLGRTTYYTYDAANRLIGITNAMGGVVRFEYDNGTNRTAVIDPAGNITRFYYDAANRLSQQVDPWGRTNFFAYDADGNRTEAIDRNGRRRTFSYDGLNRRTREFWWDGTNLIRIIEFTFNAQGLMTSAGDPASHMAFEFDGLNRLARATQSGVTNQPDFTLTYVYDGITNVVSVTDNWGVQVASEYDARDRLSSRVWNGGRVPGASVRLNYDVAGNRTNVLRFADAASIQLVSQSHYTYNAIGAITDIIHANADGAPVANYQYQHDPAQQIVGRTLNSQLSTYKYDLTGQLTDALYSPQIQPDESYGYDANGNRIGGGYIVTSNNQVIADGAFTYRYDAEGNLVARTNLANGVATTYRYDHRNRLLSVVDNAAGGSVIQTVEFTYDALDRRISKNAGGVATRFLYDQEHAWADVDGVGAVTARYLIGIKIDEVLARYWPSNGVNWYLTDNVGTVRDILEASGAVVNHISYASFGAVLEQSAPTFGDRFLFTGREWDSEIECYFFRARFYSPSLGRFLSVDPVGFDANDYNLYRYAGNNPIANIDPTGLQPTTEYANLLSRISAAVTKAANAVGGASCPSMAVVVLSLRLMAPFSGLPPVEPGAGSLYKRAAIVCILKKPPIFSGPPTP